MAVHNLTADAETFTCNVFLVTGEETTLVDAGAMPGIVDAIGEHVENLDRVVLTHQHGDHVEQLDAVVEAFDPDVYAYGEHAHRTHELSDGDTVEVGDETCEAIYTPGHADDHVSFVGESTIYSGDVVVHDDGAFEDGSFGRTDMAGQSREELIESIERILDRLPEGVESMYAGHGGEFHGDVRRVIERALERAERREPKYPEE
ncbi:MBL fold metallo-hydrolase [Halalkalicoccus jeotgali]|uniref:Flavoprotein n=1 Tax=Halalkalicoccus jeotgali (strain DSM 18796 / CECT 7217 / JCM 14584 / KCTC 4019 / B3) TaxID=795797 RepID=D8J806_HALJB|nr:MBL fold metallo-hydrolase [Halalkalicoccus jeotgali]ADJ14119.1 flavoprotein [Halalkalicoccus jeotgali B3]ELY34699.1 flavoprotein [Halalkalicoccus jeotgali B3]